MDELAEAAGVARQTLYNQFASKEAIFREMLLGVSGQLEDAFPIGMGILDCRNPTLAAHQFTGMLSQLSRWPWMVGREGVPVPGKDIVEETIRMFLSHYRRPRPKKRGRDSTS